jgi:RHS repeat-associated protein
MWYCPTVVGLVWAGRGVSSTADGVTTNYVYDGDNVVGDFQNGTLARTYVTPFLDQNLGMTDLTGAAPATYYYSQDGLGSVRTLTDGSGMVANRYDYTAFGQAAPAGIHTAGHEAQQTVDQRYTYTGREATQDPSLMYYRWRMYAPGVGRFVSRDPIYYQSDVNIYAYSKSSITAFRDPFGLEWEKTDACTTVQIDFAGGEGYFIIGGGAKVSGSRTTCDCCNTETGEIAEDDYVEIKLTVSGQIGFGIGKRVNVFGHRIGLLAKGPQLALDLEAKFIKKCGTEAVEANPHADFYLDLTVSGSGDLYGQVSITGGGKVHGDYGLRIKPGYAEFYIASNWEYGAWVNIAVGPVSVPFKIWGDKSEAEDKVSFQVYP